MARELYAEALQLIRGRVAEAMQRFLPTSLAAGVERLERELQLVRERAGGAELVQLLETLAEYVAIQRRAEQRARSAR